MRTLTVAEAVEALYNLNTGVVGVGAARHERPHKPALLLAVFDALAAGIVQPDRVTWSQWVRERFRVYFEGVQSRNDACAPELPFFHLRSEGFWQPRRISEAGEIPLGAPPLVGDAVTDQVFARFVQGWDVLVTIPVNRMVFRDALVSRYFPHARAALAAHFIEPAVVSAPAELMVAEAEAEEEEPAAGRSAAFRRRVLEIYDFQCVACGLRIWMPERELSFVDAAHLVPFAETRNDHPTNGLALCKNHHWALDQRLIAPDADAVWRVSRLIEPRRSRGEDELARLAGQSLLRPAEPAFAPEKAGLEWRFGRLLR